MELRNNAADIKKDVTIGGKKRTEAEESKEKGKDIVEFVKDLKYTVPPRRIHGR